MATARVDTAYEAARNGLIAAAERDAYKAHPAPVRRPEESEDGWRERRAAVGVEWDRVFHRRMAELAYAAGLTENPPRENPQNVPENR